MKRLRNKNIALVRCAECPKSMNAKSLKSHMNLYHRRDEEPYFCPDCAEGFSLAGMRARHYKEQHAGQLQHAGYSTEGDLIEYFASLRPRRWLYPGNECLRNIIVRFLRKFDSGLAERYLQAACAPTWRDPEMIRLARLGLTAGRTNSVLPSTDESDDVLHKLIVKFLHKLGYNSAQRYKSVPAGTGLKKTRLARLIMLGLREERKRMNPLKVPVTRTSTAAPYRLNLNSG